jgi:hypothetical protein
MFLARHEKPLAAEIAEDVRKAREDGKTHLGIVELADA